MSEIVQGIVKGLEILLEKSDGGGWPNNDVNDAPN